MVQPAEPTALPLAGMPTPPPPEPTAADLVRAWCEGWSRSHRGQQPDPSVVKRVAGICKAVAKDRTDLDSWRAAWRAALAAGQRGRYDVIGELASPVVTPSGRANHYLAIARDASDTPTAGALAAALTPQVGA